MSTPVEQLPPLIEKALRKAVEDLVAREAAASRVEREIRAKTAEIAATVLQRWDMHFRGDQLIITVDFKNPLPPAP